MSTPRLNLVYDAFVRGIGTRWETAFYPTTDQDIPDSDLVEKEIITRYVNRALGQLFSQIISQYTPKEISEKFPELVKKSNAISTISGIWTKASPYLHLHTVIGGWTEENVYLSVWDAAMYPIAKTQQNRSYIATTSKPALIQLNEQVHIFPTTLNDDIYLEYIAMPVNPTTGAELTQNGTYDMPFGYHWIDKLSQIAIELYNQASQETA